MKKFILKKEIEKWMVLYISFTLIFYLRLLVNMKDVLKRLIIGVISGAYMWYLIFLFMWWQTIVGSGYEQYNLRYFLILMLVLLVLFIFFSIHPIHFRMTKWTLFVMWIFLIIIWNGVLLDDVKNYIFVWDLFEILWVVLALLARTNVLITSKITKQSKDKKVEVIEV